MLFMEISKTYAQAPCLSIRTIRTVHSHTMRKKRIVTDHQDVLGNNKNDFEIHDCGCRNCQRTKMFADLHACCLPLEPRNEAKTNTENARLLQPKLKGCRSLGSAQEVAMPTSNESSNPQRQKCWDQQKKSRCQLSMLLLKVRRKCILTAFFNIRGVSPVEERRRRKRQQSSSSRLASFQ